MMAEVTEKSWNPGHNSIGDPIGYVKGHVSKEEAIAAAQAGGWCDELDESDLHTDSIWHGYLRCVPSNGNLEYDMKWIAVPGPASGAFPVTFWDQCGGPKWHPAWTDAPSVGAKLIEGGPDNGSMWHDLILHPDSSPETVAHVLKDSYTDGWIERLISELNGDDTP